MSEELKVVLTQRAGKTSVGVQAEGCDPVVTVIPGTVEEVFPHVPEMVAGARVQWEQNPRYPKTERATPLPPVRTPVVTRSAASEPAPKKVAPPQSKLF